MSKSIVITLPRRLVFSLVPLVVLLVAAELVQRVSDALKASSRRPPPAYSYFIETASGEPITGRRGSMSLVLDPHLIYRQKPNQRLERVTINAQGFRGPDFVRERSTKARVVILGGSVAFGYGASSDAAVWSVPLARLVTEGVGREVEVLNAGVCGYDSMQERILLETELLDYAPDVVVLVDGWNDMNQSCEVAPEKRLAMPTFHELDQLHVESTRWLKGLLRLSALYRSFERGLRHNAVVTSEHWRVHPEALSRYRRNLEAMGRLARSIGARVVVVAQPEPYGRTQPPPAAEAAVLAKWDVGDYSSHARADYPPFREQAREAAKTMGAELVDASPVFDGLSEQVFIDRVHLNDLGNELLAKAVAPAVVSALSTGR